LRGVDVRRQGLVDRREELDQPGAVDDEVETSPSAICRPQAQQRLGGVAFPHPDSAR
jgi:hypothetical protein